MALNHKNQQDQTIRKKILSLRQDNYDSKSGWEQLSSQLQAQQKQSAGKLSTPVRSIWKGAAAAIVLVSAGFLTGRFTSKTIPASVIEPVTILTSDSNIKTGGIKGDIALETKVAPPDKRSGTVSSGSKRKIPAQKNHMDKKEPPLSMGQYKARLVSNDITAEKQPLKGQLFEKKSPISASPQPAENKGQYALNAPKMSTAHVNTKQSLVTVNPVVIPVPDGQATADPLPVISMTATDMGPASSDAQSALSQKSRTRQNIYRTLRNSKGAFADFPIKIRL